MAEAQNGTKMMLGARMLREAQEYATNVYEPALAAWQAAAHHEADPNEANTAAYRDATYALTLPSAVYMRIQAWTSSVTLSND